MAQDRKPAASVARDPKGEPTPEEHGPPVDQEDAPRGQPTSDRFHTEQAQQTGETDAKDA